MLVALDVVCDRDSSLIEAIFNLGYQTCNVNKQIPVTKLLQVAFQELLKSTKHKADA